MKRNKSLQANPDICGQQGSQDHSWTEEQSSQPINTAGEAKDTYAEE